MQSVKMLPSLKNKTKGTVGSQKRILMKLYSAAQWKLTDVVNQACTTPTMLVTMATLFKKFFTFFDTYYQLTWTLFFQIIR